MKKLTSHELKDVMFNFDIPSIELAHYIRYSRQHVSLMRNDKHPITPKFQVLLCDFLVKHRGLDFERAAVITGLNDK